jgi:hypothetical protein
MASRAVGHVRARFPMCYGTHFTDPTGDGWTREDIKIMRRDSVPFHCHSFELACADLNIEHRLTKPRHP